MRHGGFQHRALIYHGAEEYLAGTVPYLREGIEVGQPLLVAVGPEQTAVLKAELGGDAEAVRFVDMRALGRNPASIIPLWRDFVDGGAGQQLRGIGEPVWASRSAAALEECRRHEALLNVAFDAGTGWDLLCPYDAATLGDEILEQVANSHPLVCRHGECEASPSFDPAPDAFAGRLPPPAAGAQVFPFEVSELAEVRRLVATAAAREGLDDLAVADLVTATSELAANSVMHGGGSGTLRLWRQDQRLIVEVEDGGTIEEQLVGRVRPDVAQKGGRGLWLANALCDLVQIRSGERGTTVRLHLLAAEAAYV
ncbi:MAG TPA: sensor histidine kinase [Solirubrobacterales bacterium]|nr:sensor histidine kinase [Solirubrobacterales bacterium]